MKGEEINPADVAASFQKSVVDTLVSRAMIALEETGMKKFAIAGGVASNTAIRAAFKEECEKERRGILSSVTYFVYRQRSNDRFSSLL